MQNPVTVAAVQLCSTPDRSANLARLSAFVAEAAGRGATFVATPENSDAIAPRAERLAGAETLEGPFIEATRALARRHGVHLLVGSFAERRTADDRIHNTSVLLAPDGGIVAVYRKLHLFDADPADGVAYRESETVVPGDAVVTTDAPFGKVGLSICYDLRFPELYRVHADRGASVLTVPAAFTVPTGRAHWEVLLRARAIENQAFVVAPAQVGEHFPGRRSYGRSLVVGPWGDVLADAGEAEGVVLATLDPQAVASARRMVPALSHRRLPTGG
jgi:predicted amidohydrolase